MAQVLITLKIMPESPGTNLKGIEEGAKKKIEAFGAELLKSEQVPIAFGLKSLNITIVMDEKKGDTEPLEKDILKVKGVNSVDVIDVRRTIG